ncbi:RidA family protein [Vogesella sp. GCM10023246]|uniref:RidA family protein n=1 Tax=Vogesella oryzagri TaxID=3160864 RepID=A0ABV1M6W8_9NEIS
MSAEQTLAAHCADVGLDPAEALQIGGHYTPVLRHGDEVFISGQVPRVGDAVVVTGKVGDDCSEDAACHAARISTLRCLILLQQTLGSLQVVARVLRMNVYVQSAAGFSRQSEVANAASEVLYRVLGDAGVHTRTSLGVYQLPKNAAVEIDMQVAVRPSDAETA